MSHTLTHQQARRFYDRLGSWIDMQRFYENPAVTRLRAHADFEHASAVIEFGCGTGRFAAQLLSTVLPPDCRYLGVDISPTMARLALARLGPWATRAAVRLTDGSPQLPEPGRCCDRFVSIYVLDLLSEQESRAVVAEAARLLVPGGRLCLASLTCGQGPLSRRVSRLWSGVFARHPQLVGGCRPVSLLEYVPADRWRIERELVPAFGLCSEVVVASSPV
jgi:ubiquinone/menaquinone biosynthesis C-methylase UbiE